MKRVGLVVFGCNASQFLFDSAHSDLNDRRETNVQMKAGQQILRRLEKTIGVILRASATRRSQEEFRRRPGCTARAGTIAQCQKTGSRHFTHIISVLQRRQFFFSSTPPKNTSRKQKLGEGWAFDAGSI